MASSPTAETRAGKRSAVHEFKNKVRSFHLNYDDDDNETKDV